MEKINIAKLLKDCPKGMELDCTMFDDVSFVGLQNSSFPIIIHTPNGCKYLNAFGCYHDSYHAKCVIFPKGKTTWEGFVPPCKFKDGDIVADEQGNIAIYKQIHKFFNEPYVDFYCGLAHCNKLFVIKNDEYQNWGKIKNIKFATEEEKEKLFNAIQNHGYKWNTKTKTLEKLIKPKFKVGDKIALKNNNICMPIQIAKIDDKFYYFNALGVLPIEAQNEYKLVPDKFDITILKPFDKVLTRCSSLEKWRIQLFEKYDKTCSLPFICIGHNKYKQCIPYEGNEHLLDTADSCSDYYRL